MHNDLTLLSDQDMNLVWELAGAKPCSLEVKPGDKDNWIERAGGSLPNYICEVAKGVMRSGKSRSSAIAIAVSRIKKWAAGGDNVNADTRAKAAKALAQWEALKARHASKKLIKATNASGDQYFMLSAVSDVSLDQVREAWRSRHNLVRDNLKKQFGWEVADTLAPSAWVVEVYVSHIIVEFDQDTAVNPVDANPFPRFARVPYTVSEGEVSFGMPEAVELLWIDEENDWKAEARR